MEVAFITVFIICLQNGLFGAGIYLSSELGVSLPYSSTGGAWGNSLLGGQMSCVALCETIDHPDVKCKQPGNIDQIILLKLK